MKPYKKVSYDILMSILPVMIGVYLGIYFNNRNEDLKQGELKTKALNRLINESHKNMSTLNESLEYFAMLRDSTDHYLREQKAYKQFSFWKGLNPPTLSSTAYSAAQMSNTFQDMDITTLELISSSYASYEDIKQQESTYFSSITDKIGMAEFSNDRYLIILFNYSYDMHTAVELAIKETESLKNHLEQLDNDQ